MAGLSQSLNILRSSYDDEEIAILDDIIGPRNHDNSIGKHLFHRNDLDVVSCSKMELANGLSKERGRRGDFAHRLFRDAGGLAFSFYIRLNWF